MCAGILGLPPLHTEILEPLGNRVKYLAMCSRPIIKGNKDQLKQKVKLMKRESREHQTVVSVVLLALPNMLLGDIKCQLRFVQHSRVCFIS